MRSPRRSPMPALRLVARAGHSPWIDEPDHIATMISAFLTT